MDFKFFYDVCLPCPPFEYLESELLKVSKVILKGISSVSESRQCSWLAAEHTRLSTNEGLCIQGLGGLNPCTAVLA